MAIPFKTIDESFRNLRAFILHDLELIVSRPKGGNYAAVLLITSACEALGRLRYGTEDGGGSFFRYYLLPEGWQSVAAHLYDALRNGLAHAYATKMVVQVGDRPVEIVISWREKEHLSFASDQSQLFINVQVLATSLHKAFGRYEKDLRSDTQLRELYHKWITRRAQVHVTQQYARETWQRLLAASNRSS